MPRLRWIVGLLGLALLVGAMPVHGQEPKDTILIVDPSKPDSVTDLLNEDEIARIDHLQNDVVYTLAISQVSPDDAALLVSSGEDVGFLNLDDGSLTPIPADLLGSYTPLPLLGLTHFSWLDATTLGCLAIDFNATSESDALKLLKIDRQTLAVDLEPIVVPPNTALISVAPNLTRFLLALLPTDPSADANQAPSVEAQVRVGLPHLSSPEDTIPLPAAYQRRNELARGAQAGLLRRFQLMQDDQTDGTVEMTTKTLDIVLYDARSGASNYVTTLPETSSFESEAWTSDSARLAASFLIFDGLDDPRGIYDGALISEIFYRDVTGNIPPEANPVLQGNRTYLIDANSGAVAIMPRSNEPNPPLLFADSYAPDNSTLLVKALHPARLKGRAYPVYLPPFSERASYRFYNGDMVEIGRLESNVLSAGLDSNPSVQFVTPDEIIFRGAVGGNRHPFYYNRVSGELRNLADQAGSYFNVAATHQSRRIVFTRTSYTEPPDIYSVGWDGSGLRRITWLNEELRQEVNLRQDPVSFRLRNGQVRVGTLIQSADAPFPPKKGPLVVWQEGGPGVPMFNQWDAIVERPYALLPSFGFPLLITPLAGRPGYTPATYNALADSGNFGQLDIDEQAEIVNQVIARGWAAPGRIGITGCSYGGYFTLQSIVRYPKLYAAANPQCALVDTITEWTRGYNFLMPYLEGLPPYSNLAQYRADSPIYNSAAIKAAVLTFHGSEDFLPVVQNENLNLLLANRGLKVKMVKFMGEGHGLMDPANQLYAAQEQISWFRVNLE